MAKKYTIFDFLTQIMLIWGISILSLCFFCLLLGEMAIGHSSIFHLGSTGIPIATAMQFFGLAIIITILKFIFFTDMLIKEWSIMLRTILMFTCVIISVGIFAAIFWWFPVNQIKPWLMFLICFFIYGSISVAVSVIKERSDNNKMQEALERLKGEEL